MMDNLSIESEIQSDIDMSFEVNRLGSYADPGWRCQLVGIDKLARSGFYYAGREDHVRCAFCKVELGNWEADDDVEAEHRTWASRCPFLRGHDVGNVPIDSTEASSGSAECGTRANGTIEIRPNSSRRDRDSNGELGTASLLDVRLHDGPSFRSYSTYESRLKSFEEWPRGMKQRPEQLADAGFFYTGKGDQTVCFHCGGALNDWHETDEPWEQHAKWIPECAYILSRKGEDFVRDAVVKNRSTVSADDVRESVNDSTVEIGRRMDLEGRSNANASAEDAANESKDYDDFYLCKICFSEQRSVLFLPCGHLIACKRCARSIGVCAVCTVELTATVRVFLPKFIVIILWIITMNFERAPTA